MKGRIEGNDVIISKGDFDHLLNCLANQKWIPLPEKQSGVEIECQKAIDECWVGGMEVLYGKYGIPGHVYKLSVEEYHSLNSEGLSQQSWPKDDENDTQPRPSFKQALTTLINQYSKENGSDTPDFILAKFLTDTLKAFNKATNRREDWYGNDSENSHDISFDDWCDMNGVGEPEEDFDETQDEIISVIQPSQRPTVTIVSSSPLPDTITISYESK